MNSTEMLDPPAAPRAVPPPPTRKPLVPAQPPEQPTAVLTTTGSTHEPRVESTAGQPDDSPPESLRPESWEHVQAAQNGDNAAFGRLYGEYAQVVYRYVFLRVSDHSLAEDITSETFLRALRRIASVSYQGKDVAAWFITIARNLILDHLKSSRNRLEVPTAELFDGARNRPDSGPEHCVLSEITQEQVLECVRLLSDDQRECIQFRFLQGLSVAETARLMHRNEGAVKALQHRAIRRLAELLPEDVR